MLLALRISTEQLYSLTVGANKKKRISDEAVHAPKT